MLVPLLGCRLKELLTDAGPPSARAARLVFVVQPHDAMQDSVIGPPVQVAAVDSAGNVVAGFADTVTVALVAAGGGSSNARLAGTTSVAADSGVAAFVDLRIDQPGTGYALRVSVPGLGDATSAAFAVAAAAPWSATHLAFGVQPADAQAGRAIVPPVEVRALDDSGNVVATYAGPVTVAVGTNPGAGTLSGTTAVTAVNGVATFDDLRIDKPASGYTLVASASGLTGVTSAAFEITAPPPAPASRLSFTRQPSTAHAGSVITPSVNVAAVDSAGNVVGSYTGQVHVAIGTNPAGGALKGTLAVAAANGVATFNDLSIDRAGSGYTLVASTSGLAGATSAAFDVTSVNQPPVAGFTSSCGGLACTFTSTSSDPDGTIAGYAWAFGDGGTASSQNPSHTYGADGTYTVALTVTDNQGATNTVSQAVTVTAPNQPPTVDAGADETAVLGLGYSLQATFSDPNNDGPWSYTIDWGDGTTTAGSAASQGAITGSHTFGVLTSYTITVTVTDSHGASGTDSKVVTVIL